MKSFSPSATRAATVVSAFALAAVAVGVFIRPAHAQSGILTVLGSDSIYASPAGNNGTPSGANAPQGFTLGTGTERILTFSSVTGTVGLNSSKSFGADGGVYGASVTQDVAAYGGLTGILDSSTNYVGALFGVFTNGTPVGSTTAQNNISGTENDHSFSSSLNEVFFIGDGLDDGGGQQEFFVPDGATTLYLGIVDSNVIQGVAGAGPSQPGGYGDNTGSFTAHFTVTPSSELPEPATSPLLFAAALPAVALLAPGRRRYRRRRRNRPAGADRP